MTRWPRRWILVGWLLAMTARPAIADESLRFANFATGDPVDGAQTAAAPQPWVPTTPAPGFIRLTAMRNQDGSTRSFEITNARAMSLPHWNPDIETPPLDAVEATRIARAWLTGRNPSVARFELQSVSLSRMRRTADIDFWFYQLNFFSNVPTQPGPYLAVVLPDGSVVEPTDTGAAGAAGEPRVDQSAGPVTPPRLLRQVQPVYTDEARRMRIAGTVLVQGVVGTDGAFHDLRIVRSLDPMYGLDNEALKAATQWRFAPGMRNGQPVPVTISVELTFTLR